MPDTRQASSSRGVYVFACEHLLLCIYLKSQTGHFDYDNN